MKDVWAITCRIMSRLLARLRRRTALTAAFQSNQNDRVTLERRREDIFLASCSHRGRCLFFFLFPTRTPAFTLFIWFDSDASHMAAWSLRGCLPCGGVERTSRRGGGAAMRLTASHHSLFSDESLAIFFLCSRRVDKTLFSAFWVMGRALGSTFEKSRLCGVFAQLVARSTVGWEKDPFPPFCFDCRLMFPKCAPFQIKWRGLAEARETAACR